MIKIIKRGTKKTCTCDNCGCVFSYEEEDINVETKPTCGCFGVEGNAWVKSIMCPQCDEEVILNQTK